MYNAGFCFSELPDLRNENFSRFYNDIRCVYCAQGVILTNLISYIPPEGGMYGSDPKLRAFFKESTTLAVVLVRVRL